MHRYLERATNNLAPNGENAMYRAPDRQISFTDFNQSCGMQLDKDNEWVKLADSIEWSKWEVAYAKKFRSSKGNPAKSFQMVLGALLIQKKKGLSDRKLIKEITENPYLQYFMGMPAFSKEAPFTVPALVYFRKRLSVDEINQINDDYLSTADSTRSIKRKTKASAQRKRIGLVKTGTRERLLWMQPALRQISDIHRISLC